MRRLLIASMAVCFTAGAAKADFFSLYGTNAEAVSLGGALTAAPNGGSAAFYNPAGLNLQHKQETEVSYIWAKPYLSIDRERNEGIENYLDDRANLDKTPVDYNVIEFKQRINDIQESRAEQVPLIRGFNIGLVMPLAENRAESRGSLGVMVYVPQGPILRQRINAPETPYFVEYDDRSQRIVINTGVGFDITDRFHIGVGTALLVDIPVQMDVYAPININVVDIVGGDASGVDVGVTPLADIKMPPVFSPVAGLLWQITDELSIGATYRDEIKTELDAKANVLAETGTGRTTALPMTIKASAAFTPRQAAIGAKYEVIENLTLYSDATWSHWTQYRPPLAEFSVSNIKQLVNEIIAGSGIDDLDILGNQLSIGGAEFQLPTRDEILDLVPDYVRVNYEVSGFRNTWTPRFGAAYQINETMRVTGGYFYRPSIIGPTGVKITRTVDFGGNKTTSRLNENTLDNDHHGFSTGFFYKTGPYQLGLAALYVYLPEKTVEKENNEDLQFEDESAVLGRQTTAFGYPRYTYGGSVVGGMLQAGVSF